jgi:hypothetical protein
MKMERNGIGDMNETIGISTEARTALNVLAIRAIEVAQRANQGSSRLDRIGIRKSLDEIEGRVREARQEIDR